MLMNTTLNHVFKSIKKMHIFKYIFYQTYVYFDKKKGGTVS